MQAPPSNQSYRGVQRNPHPGTVAYRQGKKATALSIQRYHILCAALQNKYEVRDIVPIAQIAKPKDDEDDDNEHLWGRVVRVTIDFSQYSKEFKLHPLQDVELWKPDDLLTSWRYNLLVEDDWRMREGGVLHALAEYGDFFSMISYYHSSSCRSSTVVWNTLFESLRNSGYRKNIIPCMFFGQRVGCLDQSCPFLHDREAVLADRALILGKRREKFKYKQAPTVRQQMTRYNSVLDVMAGNDQALRTEIEKSEVVDESMSRDRAYCANAQCMKPWQEDQKRSLKACKGCKFTMYCSHECQKQDWPRHKKDPCAPIEDIVENDDLWNPVGTRKGTTFVKTHKDVWTMTLSGDA